MDEFIYTGPDDGKNDDVKVENEPEAWGHQVQWEFEVSGLLPLAKEPTYKRKRRFVDWLIKFLSETDPGHIPF